MTGFGEQSSGGAMRLSDDERADALTALTAHRTAGRLDGVGFEARQLVITNARARSDLVPVFADLPEPRPVWVSTLAAYAAPGAALSATSTPPVVPQRAAAAASHGREVAMALAPFAALILFFTTGNWLWFLGIPIVSIVLYGPGGRRNSRRR